MELVLCTYLWCLNLLCTICDVWTYYALFVVLELVLCTIYHVWTYYGACIMHYAIFVHICGIMEVILLYDAFQLSSAIVCKYYIVIYIWIAGIQAKTEQKVKKLGFCRVQVHGNGTKCPLPCASTRQICHASIVYALLGADLLMTREVWHTA
jgi:hypothetical protein